MITPGLNAVFHDSAAALVVDSVLITAAEKERFEQAHRAMAGGVGLNCAMNAQLRDQGHQAAPVLANTAFKVRGLPIVCSPKDALEVFHTTPLDALVIGRPILKKPRAEAS